MRNWTQNIKVFNDNRRKHGRIGIELACTTLGPIIDASARGMCIKTGRLHPVHIGGRIRLDITLPDRCAVLFGRVVRCRPLGLLHKEVGIELEESEHTRVVLAEMLRICSVRGTVDSSARRSA